MLHSTSSLLQSHCLSFIVLFFFTDPPTTEIYTLSLHDALPIWSDPDRSYGPGAPHGPPGLRADRPGGRRRREDRKSTRLNSSHQIISYAVFCLKKKKTSPAMRRACMFRRFHCPALR